MTKGRLVGTRIVVWNTDDSRRLFGQGYYGKPLGISKPKGSDFDAPLMLDLMEGLYLIESQDLKVYDSSDRPVRLEQLRKLCRNQYMDFEAKYVVFDDLRKKGYVVTPGIKFGCDFAVYEHGPGIDHAPYLVEVFRHTDHIAATGIVLAGRLATTVRKQFVLAIPTIKEKKVEYVGFDWWRA